MFHQKIYMLLLLLMNYTINHFKQTIKQIEIIQTVVSSEVSKLNLSVMNQKLVNCHPTISPWLMHGVIM